MSSESALHDARELALTILERVEEPGSNDVERAITGALAAVQAIDPTVEVDVNALRREIEELITIFVAEEAVLSDNQDHVPWLAERRASIEWKFWDRYKRLLRSQKLPPQGVRRLNEITDDVLGRLESPGREGAWDRRGMVVGQVQSGKTANYVGLICKAADAGYRVIVVLAGMHDSLRSQTQRRVDEGFLGFDSRTTLVFNDSERNSRIGAGRLVGNAKLLPVFSYTSSLPKGDFKRTLASSVAAQVGSDPVVLVVKKNKTILENLIAWTKTGALRDPSTRRQIVMDQPLLVIDDEADNASVNTKDIERELDESGELLRESDPATINSLIRTLLSTFEKSAYVGYTATPFANIFIWEEAVHSIYGEDLFPRSFIVRLPPPSNYIGPAQVFGVPPAGSRDDEPRATLPIIRHLDDYENFIPEKHRKDLVVGPTPGSLKEAILAFLLACAVRRARGQTSAHNSMLIHVTRFIDVQAQIVDRIGEELEGMRNRLRMGEGSSANTLVDRLRTLWVNDFEPTSAAFKDPPAGKPVSWSQVKAQLLEAVSRIEVHKINGSSADALEYAEHPEGLNVIAIGGDKLSRGLTLEGLTISYYLRASRMYDTLMQMGRWFGYRPGYLDLCRLYTTAELEEWYRDITYANEELLEEFDAMAAAGGTPRDYGLRVKKHPAGLLITARAKMRNGQELELDYSGSGIPTTSFSLNPGDHQSNLELVDRFIRDQIADGHLDKVRGPREAHMFRNVPGTDVADFLEAFRTSPRARRANGSLLARYITTACTNGELSDWSIALITSHRMEGEHEVGGLPVGLISRAPDMDGKDTPVVTDAYSVGQLLSPPDEWIDLSQAEFAKAVEITRTRFEQGLIRTKRKTAPEIDGISTRRARPPQRGLLLLYPLDPKTPRKWLPLEFDWPIFGFFASFPVSPTSRPIKYEVNNVFWQLDLGLEA